MDEKKMMEIIKMDDADIFSLKFPNNIIKETTINNRDLLAVSIIAGSINIVKYLLKQNLFNLNKKVDRHGHTYLSAIFYQWFFGEDTDKYEVDNLIEIAKALIDAGADMEISDNDGNTVLLLFVNSVFRNNEDMFDYLLDKGANFRTENKLGIDAFFRAATRGELNFVKKLISRGADVNKKYFKQKDRTILHEIAADSHWKNGLPDVYEYLLDHGANVNARDENGYTPLMLSIDHTWVFSDELGMARMLLKYGADWSVVAFDGASFGAIANARGVDVSPLAGLAR